MECKRAQNLLDAHLDNELDALHSADLESHLHDCTSCTALLHRRQTLQQALRKNLPYFTAPHSLHRQLEHATAAPRSFSPLKLALAAALFLVIGSLTTLFLLHTPTTPSQLPLLADAIESAHMCSLQPDHLLDVVSTDQHTVKPWFAGKLPFTPPVRDLAPDGFPLIGGRLDIINHQPTAALIYHRNQHTINLFIWPDTSADIAPSAIEPLTTPRGYHLLHWRDHAMTFWAASDLNEQELTTFATLFRAALASK